MPDLPLVIGPGANRQAAQLAQLMADTPSLQPQLTSATWVGGRRWDLNFQSGETVALPEGERRRARPRCSTSPRATKRAGSSAAESCASTFATGRATKMTVQPPEGAREAVARRASREG